MLSNKKNTKISGIKRFKISYARLVIIALVLLGCINTIRFLAGNIKSGGGHLEINANSEPGNLINVSINKAEYPYFNKQDISVVRDAQIAELLSVSKFDIASEKLIFAKIDYALPWLDSGKQEKSEKQNFNKAIATGILNPLLLVIPTLEIPAIADISAANLSNLMQLQNLQYDAYKREASATLTLSSELSADKNKLLKEAVLSTYYFNASDLGLNIAQIDKEQTYNIDYGVSDAPEPVASFFAAAPCHPEMADSELCNQIVFSIGSRKLLIRDLPAAIGIKLWNKMPEQAENPVIKFNIKFELNSDL